MTFLVKRQGYIPFTILENVLSGRPSFFGDTVKSYLGKFWRYSYVIFGPTPWL